MFSEAGVVYKHRRAFSITSVATLGASTLIGILPQNTPPKTEITNPGNAEINSLTLGPVSACNGSADVTVDGTTVRKSWNPEIIGPFKSPIKAWRQRTLHEEEAVTVCLKHSGYQTETEKNGYYTFTFRVSSDPDKSDIQFLIDDKNPLSTHFDSDCSWLCKAGNFLEQNQLNAVNLILGTNYDANSSMDEELDGIARIQAAQTISTACGDEIVSRLTADGINGGNMFERAEDDVVSSIPSQFLTEDKAKILSKIRFRVDSDGTGVYNQYTSLLNKIVRSVSGLEFRSPGNTNCKDVAPEVLSEN